MPRSFGIHHRDSGLLQLPTMFGPVPVFDDVESLVALIEPFLDERQKDPVLLGFAVEERADVTRPAEGRPRQANLTIWSVYSGVHVRRYYYAVARSGRDRQMASDIDVKVKPDSFKAGTIIGERRSGTPIAWTFPGASIASTL